MSRVYQIHIDTSQTNTATAQTNISTSATSMVTPARVYYPQITKQANNPFNCTVVLGQTHRNLRYIRLKCAEVPVAFFNIRAPYNSVIINGTTYTISPNNYTISTLVTALNTATTGVGTFAAQTSTSTTTYTPTSGSATLTTFTSASPFLPNLLYFLGFTNGQNGTSITSTNSYLINFDTYINVYIPSLRTASLDPAPITFKIPVSVASGNVMYYNENSQFTQEIQIFDKSVRFDRLEIQVRDRFGQIIDNRGIDWSFTLEMESDT